MTSAVAEHIPDDTTFPEIPAFVDRIVLPFLEGPSRDKKSVDDSFGALRNVLSHGGGLTKSVTTRLLTVWRSRFATLVEGATWLAEVAFVVKKSPGSLGVLRGPSPQAIPYSPNDYPAVEGAFRSPNDVVLVRGDRVLSLWPFKLYGPPQLTSIVMSTGQPVPLVYSRRGEVRLRFTPVGSEDACESEADEKTFDAFRELFRLDDATPEGLTPNFAVRGFDTELRRDAERLIGRSTELDRLRKLVASTPQGIIWISGPAGIGKSYVVARLTADLLDEMPRAELVLPFRFRAGDDRCSRDSFVRYAVERLEAWSEMPRADDGAPTTSVHGKNSIVRLRSLLSRRPRPRVLFVLDGLDEIAGRDPHFVAEVPLALRQLGVIWICAGRQERGLADVFTPDNSVLTFPGGLPPIARDDIRAMLLERIGRLRDKILRQDHENGGRILNPFVERVTEAAGGLPLYVNYVIGDIVSGRLNILDAGKDLPPSLEAYHEILLSRYAVGTLQQLVTPLVTTLAVAKEPVTDAFLTAVLGHRLLVPEGDRALSLVRQGLSGIAPLLRRAQTPEGGEGYAIFHQSFRQHVLESDTTRDAALLSARALCDYCAKWPEHGNGYALRHYAEHLLDSNRLGDVFALVRDEVFRQAQMRAFPTDADLPLRSVRTALRGAAVADNPGAMAEFVLLHVDQLTNRLLRDSPLGMLRAAGTEAALALADLCGIELSVLWYLLLAWELVETRRMRDADTVLARLRRQRVPRLSNWQTEQSWPGDLAAMLLKYVWDVDPSGFTDLHQRLLTDEQRCTLSEQLAAEGQHVIAGEIARLVGDPKHRVRAMASIAMAQAAANERRSARDSLAEALDYANAARPGEREEALRLVVRAQARSGARRAAFHTAQLLKRAARGVPFGDPYYAESLAAIASSQISAGRTRSARRTLVTAFRTAGAETTWRAFRVSAFLMADFGTEVLRDLANTLPPELLERDDILRDIVVAHLHTGEFEEAATVAQLLRDQFFLVDVEHLRDLNRQIFAAAGMPNDFARVTRALLGPRAFILALRMVHDLDVHREWAEALGSLAGRQAQAGDDVAAQTSFAKAVMVADGLENQGGKWEWQRAMALSAVAFQKARCGDRESSRETFIKAIDVVQSTRDFDWDPAHPAPRYVPIVQQASEVAIVRGLAAIASKQASAEDREAARQTLERALTLTKEIGEPSARAAAGRFIATAFASTGEFGAARSMLSVTLGDAVVQRLGGELVRVLNTVVISPGSSHLQKVLQDAVKSHSAAQNDTDEPFWKAVRVHLAAALENSFVSPANRETPDAAGEDAAPQDTLGEPLNSMPDLTSPESGNDEDFESGVKFHANARDFTAALKVAERIQDKRTWAQAVGSVAEAQYHADQPEVAEQTLSKAIDDANAFAAKEDRARALSAIASTAWKLERRDLANHAFSEALRTAQTIEREFDRESALWWNTAMQARAGLFAEALDTAEFIRDEGQKASAIAVVAKRQVEAGFAQGAIETAGKILTQRDEHLVSIAAALANTGDKENFKRLLELCAHHTGAAYLVCVLLAQLYPEQAASIAQALRGRP
jgi:tetratricopeptide (TPR) repeat protein